MRKDFNETLYYHPHLHLIVADGIFSGETGLQFDEAILTPDDIVGTQDCIQNRVLRLLCRRGFFSKEEVEKMLSYNQSGFSLDAKVRIESWDKDGLERLIRYCARPLFASENLRWHSHLALLPFSKAFSHWAVIDATRSVRFFRANFSLHPLSKTP